MNATMIRIIAASVALLGTPLPMSAQNAQIRIADPQRASEVLKSSYPEDLRLLGIGGTVRVNIRVDSLGRADSVEVLQTSGIPTLDWAAQSAARRLPFLPPPRRMWVELPLTFSSEYQQLAPYAALPQLSNQQEALAAARARLTEAVRKSTIDATVRVLIDVDSAGKVSKVGLTEAYCLEEFGQAALGAAAFMAFNTGPAARRTIGTFDFDKGDVSLVMPGQLRDSLPSAARDTLGPDTIPSRGPVLRNRARVGQALQQMYPPELRDRGIGGSVSIWFFIDEKGVVLRRKLKASSGNCLLDRAGLAVADVMRFDPAMRNGRPIKVWVDMPIIFRTR